MKCGVWVRGIKKKRKEKEKEKKKGKMIPIPDATRAFLGFVNLTKVLSEARGENEWGG